MKSRRFDLVKLETGNVKNDKIHAILLNIKTNRSQLVIMCRYKLATCWQNFTEIYLTWPKILEKVSGGLLFWLTLYVLRTYRELGLRRCLVAGERRTIRAVEVWLWITTTAAQRNDWQGYSQFYHLIVVVIIIIIIIIIIIGITLLRCCCLHKSKWSDVQRQLSLFVSVMARIVTSYF